MPSGHSFRFRLRIATEQQLQKLWRVRFFQEDSVGQNEGCSWAGCARVGGISSALARAPAAACRARALPAPGLLARASAFCCSRCYGREAANGRNTAVLHVAGAEPVAPALPPVVLVDHYPAWQGGHVGCRMPAFSLGLHTIHSVELAGPRASARVQRQDWAHRSPRRREKSMIFAA